VQDWYGEEYYASSPAADPSGPSSGYERALRGGNYQSDAFHCSSNVRGSDAPKSGGRRNGIRLALSLE
jgi:formylglycine-generating enzyme required for sulfatase activity